MKRQIFNVKLIHKDFHVHMKHSHKTLSFNIIFSIFVNLERKKRLSGYIKERPYDLQQEINKLKNVNPREKEILNQYVVCYGKYRTRLQRQWAITYLGKFRDEMAKDFPNYSANVLEEVNRCGVTLEQFFTELESKENHTRCTEPKNIKEKDLRNLQSIIFDQKTDLVDINVYELRKRFLNKIKKNIQNSARKRKLLLK
ncbi:hypothetical protein KSF78_0008478 [Schistosoma japonicum]|nr:hypothetical protein KSF78_0008478 [Schistosoma japonicum]